MTDTYVSKTWVAFTAACEKNLDCYASVILFPAP